MSEETLNEVAVFVSEPTRLSFIASLMNGERFLSETLNRKFSGVLDSGVCSGFMPVAQGGLQVLITSKSDAKETGTALVDAKELCQITVHQINDLMITLKMGKLNIIQLWAESDNHIITSQVSDRSNAPSAKIENTEVPLKGTIELFRVDLRGGEDDVTQEMIDLSNRKESEAKLKYASHLDDDPDSVIKLKFLKELIEAGELGGGGAYLLPEVITTKKESSEVNLSLDHEIAFVVVNEAFQPKETYSIKDKTLTFDEVLEIGTVVSVFYTVKSSGSNPNALIPWLFNAGEGGQTEIELPFDAKTISMLIVGGQVIHSAEGLFEYNSETKIIKLLTPALARNQTVVVIFSPVHIDSPFPNVINSVSFSAGGELKSQNDFIYDEKTGTHWIWLGEYPKKIEDGSIASEIIGDDIRALDNPTGNWCAINPPELNLTGVLGDSELLAITQKLLTEQMALVKKSLPQVGDFKYSGNPKEKSGFGWYLMNGDRYDLTSDTGKALSALPTEYKTAYGIKVTGSLINVPTVIHSDGRTYFFRPIDGTKRKVGSIEDDMQRKITGRVSGFPYASVKDETKPEWELPSESSGVFVAKESSSVTRNITLKAIGNEKVKSSEINFDSSLVNKTGIENTVLNMGVYAYVYLGV